MNDYIDEKGARERHALQLWGDLPYKRHLEVVGIIAQRLRPQDERVPLTAACHDLLEDTETTPEELAPEVRASVILLSRNYSQGEITYHQYIAWLASQSDELAKTVKLADALANWLMGRRSGSELIKRYQRSIPVLWEGVFGPGGFSWEAAEKLVEGIEL